MSETPASELGGRRSNKVLLLAAGLGIAAAVAATVLKPSAPTGPTVSATGSLSVPMKVPEATPDPLVARDRLIEQLVADSRSEPRPNLLPSYEAVAIPCRRGQSSCEPVLARLREPDAPPALVAMIARELPRSARDQLDSLLLPMLRSDDPERQWAAVGIYRERKRAAVGSDTSCACGFGVVPSPVGEEAWLFAESPTGGGLAWEPQQEGGDWLLGLRRDPEGTPRLLIPVAGEIIGIRASEGGGTVRALRPPPAPPSGPAASGTGTARSPG